MRMAAESNTERRVLVTSMRQALWAQPALLVRGSSRRITIMRFRPANIRVINRRDDRLGRRPHCFPLAREEQRKPKPRMFLTRSSISEDEAAVPRIARALADMAQMLVGLATGTRLDALIVSCSRKARGGK